MVLELPNKRIRSFKREKPLIGTKGERKEIISIKGTITKKGLYYWIAEVKNLECQAKFRRRMKNRKLLSNVLSRPNKFFFNLCDNLI